MLVPAAPATAWACRTCRALAPALALSLVVFAYGGVRLRERPQEPAVRVGLAATDRRIGTAFGTERPARALAVARAYVDRIARLAGRGAQVIVLPEKLVGVTPAYSEELLKVFGEAARAGGVTVIAGLNRVLIPAPRNVAVVFGPDGKVLAEYEKRHLLPGPETGYKAGTDPVVFAAPGGNWGVAICKDIDFPAWSRMYGERKVTVLAAPAWDFVHDARLHSRIALVRGVENGFAIARTAQQARVVAEQASSAGPKALLVADISPGPGPTLKTRCGDWFGWVNVLLIAALLACAIINR